VKLRLKRGMNERLHKSTFIQQACRILLINSGTGLNPRSWTDDTWKRERH
jgi:hypothetical protein